MALTNEQRENINQTQYQTGTPFYANVSKIDVQKNPMLVIGIGGTGIDAMLRVKSKVNEMFKTEVDAETGRRFNAPKNIKFLGVDTDVRSFSGKKYHNMYVEPLEQMNIGHQSIDGVLQQMKTEAGKKLYPNIVEWLDPNMTFSDAAGGAGGYRQISRTCLFLKADELYNKLKNIIGTLVGGKKEKLIVFLLSGISGGTGSGAFIDIAYLVQQATLDTWNSVSTPGDIWNNLTFMSYLFMPDVSMINNDKPYIRVNGYAALKELDYLMGIPERGERFKQTYSQNIPTVNSPNAPFGVVHLLSRQLMNPDTLLPDDTAYDEVLLAAAENVTTFMANDDIDNSSNSSLTPWGYQSNIQTSVNGAITQMEKSQTRKAVGYRYGLIGTSGKVLPVKDIMMCLACNLFSEVDKMMKNLDPTNEQVIAIFRGRMKIDETSIAQELLKRQQITIAAARNDPNVNIHNENVHLIYDSVLQAAIKGINSANNQALMDSIFERIDKNLELFFKNIAPSLRPAPRPGEQRDTSIEFGPAFTQSLIVGAANSNHYNLVGLCNSEQARLSEVVNSLAAFVEQNQYLLPSRLRASRDAIINKKEKFYEYIDLMEKIYQAKLDIYRISCEIKIFAQIEAHLRAESKVTFGTIKEALDVLRNNFDANAKVVGNVDVRKSVEGSILSWNVVTYGEVDKYISDLVASHDIGRTAMDFYAEIWRNKLLWTADDAAKFDVFGNLTEFIGNAFNDMLSKSLEEYLEAKFKADSGGAANFDQYVQTVMAEELRSAARLLYARNTHLFNALSNLPERELIQVPKNCAGISAALTKVCALSAGKMEVGSTALNTRIMWNHSLHGVPLYTYGLIQQLESDYVAAQDTEKGRMGVHLRQASDDNWFDLPSVYPREVYSEGYTNRKELDRCLRAEKLFDEACKYGVIKFDATSNPNKFVFTEAGNIDAKGIYENCEKTVAKLKGFVKSMEVYLDPTTDIPAAITADGTEKYFHTDLFSSSTKESAVMWFKASYDIIRRVRAEVEKYRALEAVISQAKAEIAELDTETESLKKYINARIAGVIIKDGLIYKYAALNGEKYELVKHPALKHLDYFEFSLYSLINDPAKRPLSKAQYESLLKDIDKQFDALQNDFDTFVENANALLDGDTGFIKSIDSIEREYDGVDDGETIMEFYKEAATYLCSLVGRKMD